MQPYYDDGHVRILHGDSRELPPGLLADVVVTDPPYGLAFMGKAWDKVDQEFHREWTSAAFQALPPGGWLLAFGGTRTWHRLACGIEDAGFEYRDTIADFGPLAWLYGQGFPKGKACLKPGWEPILLARKPGSSVLQIDACRVGVAAGDYDHPAQLPQRRNDETSWRIQQGRVAPHASGRWPANVVLTHDPGCQPVGVRKVRVHWSQPTRGKDPEGIYGAGKGLQRPEHGQQVGYADPDGTETVEAWECEPECPVFLLDQQSGTLAHAPHRGGRSRRPDAWPFGLKPAADYTDQGGASRFFYTAKAGRNERATVDGEQHPTVKPLALMRWLVRLVTPPGGTVLDPFCGSGSTLVAARMEGFRAVGVEADERWCRGSVQRLSEIPPIQETLALG